MPCPAAPTTLQLTVTAGARTHSVLRSARQQHSLLRLVHNLSKCRARTSAGPKKRSETGPVQSWNGSCTGSISNVYDTVVFRRNWKSYLLISTVYWVTEKRTVNGCEVHEKRIENRYSYEYIYLQLVVKQTNMQVASCSTFLCDVECLVTFFEVYLSFSFVQCSFILVI